MHTHTQYTAQTFGSLLEIEAVAWDVLTDGTPLLSHAFLTALETSKSVGHGTGWTPMPLAIFNQQQKLVGAMPLYLKSHSYGEYVFDWSWADAYARNQMAYYPKLVSAIPFSPVTSMRLLTDHAAVAKLMLDALSTLLHQHQLSSAHVLFPSDSCGETLAEQGWLKREGVQFRWHNAHFSSMDAFLATLSHDKRKKIKQERKKIAAAGVTCRWILGADMSEADWDFFYACYCNTYATRHSTPYLTRAFFSEIGLTMPQNIVLMVAEQAGQRVASALNLYHQHALYGRYWGALSYVPNLHFELCYYQAQEFCIAHHIEYFEGGAQGEHKLARGFTPRPTCSYHQIAHPDFAAAIAQFLTQESSHIAHYTNELEERVPFKK